MARLTYPKPVGLIGVCTVVCRSPAELIVDAPTTGAIYTNTLSAAVKDQCESKLAITSVYLKGQRWAILNVEGPTAFQ